MFNVFENFINCFDFRDFFDFEIEFINFRIKSEIIIDFDFEFKFFNLFLHDFKNAMKFQNDNYNEKIDFDVMRCKNNKKNCSLILIVMSNQRHLRYN